MAASSSGAHSSDSRRVLGVRVNRTSYVDALARAVTWSTEGKSRVVCAASVHSVIEARDDPDFREILEHADLVVPDGVPLVWALRAQGLRRAERVSGPDLTWRLCALAARMGIRVGFYGSTPETLHALRTRLSERFPELEIVYTASPPFRELDADEEREIAASIADSRVQWLFVGLGCPKQERWMARQRGNVPAVMIGVGAAFDFLAGTLKRAPRMVQRAGLEWLFRLCAEPKRLWRRYLRIVPRFILASAFARMRAPFAKGPPQ